METNLLGRKCVYNDALCEIVAVNQDSEVFWLLTLEGPGNGTIQVVNIRHVSFFMAGTGYAVRLLDPGYQKIATIKVIRTFTGRGLKEAKDSVDNPVSLGLFDCTVNGDPFTRERAYEFLHELQSAGAVAEVKGPERA